MSDDNTVVISAAGSGKTTYLVRQALAITGQRVLITTYTESNEAEIRKKFVELNGHVPANVVVMTWFSMLITHGVKPFQHPLFDFPVAGMQLVSSASAFRHTTNDGKPTYWGEADFDRHYFDAGHHVFSDKLSKLVVRCDKTNSGAVIDRLTRVFPNIFVDEVQDLAGYDLDLLLKLFESSAKIILVGDPRQVTYLTHHERKYAKYADGGIVEFLKIEAPKRIKWKLDTETLGTSHRNSSEICQLSSMLYPGMPASRACECKDCRSVDPNGSRLYLVRNRDIVTFLEKHEAMQLRDRVGVAGVHPGIPAMNFGMSKGLGFGQVLIFPTLPMLKWFKNADQALPAQSRAKLYVAVTRARYGLAVVTDEQPASFHFPFHQFES